MVVCAARYLVLSTLTIILAASATAAGPKPAVNTSSGKLAVQGYDVVAYTAGTAAKGVPAFEYRWNGALWRFASAENRDRFARDPERYAPQFGGYCAWAVSRGYTANIDPHAFKIVNGKLYLNYSKSVQRMWEQDVPGNIAKGEANWPAALNK